MNEGSENFDLAKHGMLTAEVIFLRFALAEVLKATDNPDQLIDKALAGARRYPLIGGPRMADFCADRLRELVALR